MKLRSLPIHWMFFVLALVLALPFSARALNQASADSLATSILTASGRHAALVSVPRCGSGELVLSFHNQVNEPHSLVDGFESDPTLLATAQQNANALGLLGRNVYLRSGTLSTTAYSMPYADNLVDLVVVTNLQDTDLSSISYAEMERVLCYNGQAWIGRAAAESGGTLTSGSLSAWISGTHALSTAKIVSDATGTWVVITKLSRFANTHEGNAYITNAGNRFFPDYVATWPTLPQWAAKPYGGINSNGSSKDYNWGALSHITVGGGRIYGFDSAWTNPAPLCALRAQNGILLWQIPGMNTNIAGGIQAFSKGVVYGNQMIDGETGVVTGTIPIPSNWTGTVSYQVDNTTATKDILYAVGRGSDNINTLFAYDLAHQTTLYTVPNFADNNTISTYYSGCAGSMLEVVMAGGKLYACCSGTLLYCYNTADGSKNWGPVTAPATPQFIEASPNGVFMQAGYSGTVNYYFFGVADGSLKWGPKTMSSPHTYCDLAKISTLNGGNEAICTQGNGTAVDLLTGGTCGSVGWYGAGSCAPGASMSPAGFFSRRNGLSYSMALRGNVNSSDPWASDCTDSPTAVSGMILQKNKAGGCACYSVFRGSTGQSPLGNFNPEQTAVQSDRLQQGPAYGNLNAQVTPDAMDWPTHRANNNRSASVPAQVSTTKCVQLWKYTNPTQNAYNKDLNEDFYTYHDVTPPVTAGNYLTGKCYTYFAGSDGIVKCFDNSTGNLVWTFATGAWVFATPTVANGCVYVGSGDGYAYCLEAQTGRLVWKFRGAPTERRFNYFGHLISTWPILTGVLAHSNGNVYFATGLFDEYGVQVYALNGTTGNIVWQNTKAGVCLDNRPGLARVGHFPGGYMTVLGNQLMMKEHKHGYNNQLQRIAIYDLNTGAVSANDTSFPGASQNSYGFWTGREIGIMGNYVYGWGEDMHTEMEYEQYGGATTFSKFDTLGNPVRPFLVLGYPGHVDAMAWDNTEAFWEAKKFKLSGSNCLPQLFDNAIANPPPTSADASKLCTVCYSLSGWPATTTESWWKPVPVSTTNRAQALTANCLVQLSGSGDIGVLDRTTGAQYFHVNTGGDSYMQGMAVDRSGKIIVVNRTGDVVCFGTPDPVVVTPPADVSGVENGQAATFSVEAAGPGLTYQWRFNGVNIDGGTNATYSIASVSDSNAGTYDCIVANTTGTVTTALGRLSTAVTASLTSPTDGSMFSQPVESQYPSITFSAAATSLHGTITKVEYYTSGTNLLGSSTSTAPYSFTWNPTAAGNYSITCKAYDSLGKSGVSQPVNITVAALVAHFALDETSGITVHDTSGYNTSATTGYVYTSSTWTSQSLFNGGMVNNVNSWLSTGTISSMSGTAYTIGMWVNFASNGYGRGVIYCGGSNGGGGIIGGNWPQIYWTMASSTAAAVASGTYHSSISYGTWYHYAIVVTPTLVSWYINGQLFSFVQPPSGQTFKTSLKNFSFGNGTMRDAPRNNAGFAGIMDEIKIYNNALSAADVYAMYATNVPYRPPMPTVALTSPTDGQIVTATNSLTLGAAVSGSHYPMTVKYYSGGTLIGTGTTSPSYSATWSGVARGTYAVTGTITDGLGQVAASGTSNVTFSYTTAPVLSIQGGTYLNSQNLTVTCSDTSAVIYYTTDGSDPTTSSSVIASGSSIPITKTTVLKIQAYKSGYQPSEIQTAIYRIGNGLAAGTYHSLALIQGAPLWAWGNNGNGQLGDGTTTERNAPICIGGLTNPVSVSGGGWGNHTLAVDGTGAVWAWGYNYYGQLGIGSTTEQHSPVKLTGISNALSVSAGGYHSMAVKWDGSVWAWGYNSSAQLGINGTSANKTSPVQVLVAGSTALTNVAAVAAGNSHSLALKSDGTVWTWGSNYYGELGYDTGTNSYGVVAAQVAGLTGTVTAIAAGSYLSVALKSDGTVWTWGNNGSGQLGNGSSDYNDHITPTQVSGLTNVKAISCNPGGSHVLALRNDGTVWAWGENSNCQLGDGTTNDHYTPFQVSGLTNMVTVGAGGYFSMSLGNDGSLWAWGSDYYGSLGNNTSQTTGTNPAVSLSSSNAYVVFTTISQTVSESAPPFPVIAQLFCPTTVGVTVPVTITGLAVKGTDYTISGTSVTIPVGQTSGSFTITPINDTLYKASRTVILTMGTVTGATKGVVTTNTTTITDDDAMPTVTFTTGTITATETSGTLQIPIQLSAPSGVATTIPIGTSGSALGGGTDYAISGSSFSIGAGGTTANIYVSLIHRSGYQGDRTLTLTMGTPTNAALGSISVENLTIKDVDPKPITITTPVASQTVPWGQSATFSVVVDGSTPAYQWYKNGTLLAGATNASYTTGTAVVADNGAVFSVTATNAVSSATSAGTLSVVCFTPPSVNIRNPISSGTLSLPLNLNIQVDVQSPGISCIQFYQGSTLLGQISGSSSSFSWNSVPAGNYTLTAVAIDTQGQATTSSPVYITVSDIGNFDDWIVARSLTGSQTSDYSCPAGDHISNLMKYALGLDPNVPCTRPTDGTNPGLPLLGSDGANLTMTFQKDLAKGDVTYIAEASSDMVNWSPTNVTLAVTGSNGTVQTVKASVPKASNKQFLRLKVMK